MSELDLFAARQARDAAIAQVKEHAAPDWYERALATVREVAARQATLLVDDLWAAGLEKPVEARAIGPVLLSAAREGWIERTPLRRASAQAGNHMNVRTVWASKLFQPNRYEAAGREKKAHALARALWRLDKDLPGSRPDAPLSERAAAQPPEFWAGLAQVADRSGPSEATVLRVVELLREAEKDSAA